MGIRISRKQSSKRGVALVVVLFIVVLVLLVAGAVLSNSSYSASNALSVQTKNQTFNAAEAGVNVAQWNLDQNLSSGTTSWTTGTPIRGYTYQWQIVSNRLNLGGATVSDPNPGQSGLINVPAGQALLAGKASSILGGRTVYVEQMVALAPPTYLPDGAIVCGKTGQISHQQITDTSGNHHADVRCGTLISNGGGQIPDGKSYATSTNNEIFGNDNIAHINAPPPTFLTAAQLAAIQSSTLTQAQKGGPNYYTAGNVTGGTIGSDGANCVAYIGGNITLKGNSTLTNYCATTVVMGDVTIGGNANYQALPMSLTHMMYVFGSGGTVLQGTPTTVGIIYAANADVTINGAGYGDFSGGIITPNNVTMNGGGTASFHYNSTQTPPPIPNQYVVPQSQWDY
jgi:hypothetical protein